MMQYVKLHGIAKEMSRLIYGTGSKSVMSEDSEAAMYCLDAAFDCGFRAFDTAYTYGLAEENLGKWMQKRGNREQIIVIDKGCNPGQKGFADEMSPELIRQQCTESLERLQSEYSDCYILHRDDESKPVGMIVEVLNELKAEGKIRCFGGSNWKWKRIQEGNEYAKKYGLEGFSLVSPCYSLAVMQKDPSGGSITISGAENASARKYYYLNKIPVFAYSSLGRGFLSGKYRIDQKEPIENCLTKTSIAEYYYSDNVERLRRAEKIAFNHGCLVSQVCLAWLLVQPGEIFPIVGSSTKEHIEENVASLNVVLTEDEIAYLNI